MKTVPEIKKEILDNVKWESVNPHKLGGQSCGMPIMIQRGVSEDIDLTIEICYHRSTIENRKLAIKLFEKAVDEIIKE